MEPKSIMELIYGSRSWPVDVFTAESRDQEISQVGRHIGLSLIKAGLLVSSR